MLTKCSQWTASVMLAPRNAVFQCNYIIYILEPMTVGVYQDLQKKRCWYPYTIYHIPYTKYIYVHIHIHLQLHLHLHLHITYHISGQSGESELSGESILGIPTCAANIRTCAQMMKQEGKLCSHEAVPFADKKWTRARQLGTHLIEHGQQVQGKRSLKPKHKQNAGNTAFCLKAFRQDWHVETKWDRVTLTGAITMSMRRPQDHRILCHINQQLWNIHRYTSMASGCFPLWSLWCIASFE